MAAAPSSFLQVIETLEKHYGRPKPPQVTDPLEMILLENVGYLVDDQRRAAAFQALQRRVGTRPEQILAASEPALVEIARLGGILPELRARRLRQIAEIAQWKFGGDLSPLLSRPVKEGRKALKQFPSIGDPGAEKILLFGRAHRVLALDSNGLRVLLRLGYAEEKKSYSASYRAAQEAVGDRLPADFARLIRAHQLLRQHGQQLCRRSRPLCRRCPLKNQCRYFLRVAG